MSTIDQQIAQLGNQGRKRRGQDGVAIFLLGGACVTVLVTWGFGYFARGWWLRETAAGVYDPKARTTGAYFLTDWLWGCFFALFLLALFLILRPWSHRMPSVLFGVLVAVGAGFVVMQSLDRWEKAEAKTVQVLRTTAYPWGETHYECGRAEWTDSRGNLWAADTGRYENSSYQSCDFVVIFKGWKEVGHENISDSAMKRNDGSDPDVAISGDGTVSVTMNGSRVLSFPIGKPSLSGSVK